jgi:hypothetical protein
MKKIHLIICLFLSLALAFSCRTLNKAGFFFWLGGSADSAGILITDADVYLFTSESGRVASFDVYLNRKPVGSVRVGPVTISDGTEGTLLSDTFLDFDESNWNTAQTIQVKGVDDSLSDGNITYNVSFGSFTTEDVQYKDRSLPIITLVNTDDETSGVAVSPTTGTLTSESGTKAKIYYVLQTRPMRPVTIQNFTSSVTTEASAPNTSLTFTYEDWDKPQYIEVTGVDDLTIDGPQTYTISAGLTVSSDPSYNGKSVPVVTGTNADNDAAGFTVVSLNGTTTTEAGSSISFSVVMNTIPTSNVTISSIVASPATEGTVTPSNLTFTSSNWSTAQTVTVTGVNDSVADGNQTVSIVVSTATSGDTNYNGLAGPVFPSITNTDDDTRGINVTPTTGATFSESGGSQIYSVTLNSSPPPGTTVTISGISSSIPSLVNVTPASLTFDSTNWNIAQSITATVINNSIDEDTRSVTLTFGNIDIASGSRDTGYDSVSLPSNVTFSVTDDDTAGITVTPVSGLVVDENAGPQITTFTVVLNTQPTASVTIPTISSSNTSEITVSPASLTFTTGNWNVAQTVTLTSVVDGALDGNAAVTISLANATSSDAKYSGFAVPSVSATNIDSGDPEVILQNISSLTMVENGTSTITFQIRLQIQPGASVTIGPILSSDTSEAIILDQSGNPTTNRTLVFNTTLGNAAVLTGDTSTGSWNMPQTITVRSVADNFADGTIPITINIPTATGSFYAGLRPTAAISGYTPGTGNLALSITDNDTKGFTISSTTINITESASPTSGTFTVALTSAPCNTPSNLENCSAGTITIPLSSETFVAPDTTQYTFSPASLTFNETNFNIAQTVTITPVDDSVDEILTRTHTLTLGAISASGTDYDGQNPSDVTINQTDDENASPRVIFALSGTSQAFTAENGLKSTYTIRLASQPLVGNSVTVTVASTDTSEGEILISTGPDVTAGSNNYTFTSSNWNTAVNVVIKGLQDVDSANTAYSVTVGSGLESGATASWYSGFAGATGTTANLINYDVGASTITVATPASLTMGENAAAFSVFLFLQSAPTGNVTIPISTNTTFPCRLLTGPNVDQFAISTTSVTITPANWDQSGTHNRITVTPTDDPVDDGNLTCPIIIGAATSADGTYNGVNPSDVSVTLNDNDTIGITRAAFTPSPLLTSESGASATFTVRLASQPTNNVSVAIATSIGMIASISPSTLNFTSGNFATPQNVTITGADIGSSGDQAYNLNFTASTSETTTGGASSGIYDNALTATSPATNIELLYDIIPCTTAVALSACVTAPNASGGLVSSPALVTTEAGGQARYQLRLRARPSSPVTISIGSSNTNEGTVSTASLSYTTANWNTFQEVIVTGVDDLVADGNITFMSTLASLVGGGAGFNGQTFPNVSLTNNNNDSASITITPTSGLVTTESGGTATFSIVLTSQPVGTVEIPLISDNTAEGTIAIGSVVFDNTNWSTPQIVTITGIDDGITDGNIAYTIVTGNVIAVSDANYASITGASLADISVTNNDDD